MEDRRIRVLSLPVRILGVPASIAASALPRRTHARRSIRDVPIETIIRLTGGPLANKTVNAGPVTVGALIRLTRPAGSLAFYRITKVDAVPNRTSFTATAKFEPKGDGRPA